MSPILEEWSGRYVTNMWGARHRFAGHEYVGCVVVLTWCFGREGLGFPYLFVPRVLGFWLLDGGGFGLGGDRMARISISSRSTHYGIEYGAAPNGWEAVKMKRQAVWPGRAVPESQTR